MRRLSMAAFILCLAGVLLFGATVPRPAPDFTFALPNGKQMKLSQFKGQVVAVEFLLTTCPGCKKASAALQRVYEELGERGFQPLGVAINEGATELVPGYIRELRLTYPVGISDRFKAVDFLQHPIMLTMMMPQLVIIDKKGNIRAQHAGTDDFFRNEDENIKKLVSELLKE